MHPRTVQVATGPRFRQPQKTRSSSKSQAADSFYVCPNPRIHQVKLSLQADSWFTVHVRHSSGMAFAPWHQVDSEAQIYGFIMQPKSTDSLCWVCSWIRMSHHNNTQQWRPKTACSSCEIIQSSNLHQSTYAAQSTRCTSHHVAVRPTKQYPAHSALFIM